MTTANLRWLGPIALLLLGACGGGSAQPAAKTAEAPTAASAEKPSETATADAGAPAAPEAAESAKTEGAAPASQGPKPSRAPSDVLTQKDTLFMLSFDESDAGKAAEAACNKSSANDPKKTAACMAKERGKVDADGHGFKKDKEGKLVWVVVHRQGKILITTHKVHVSFGDETENTISVKPEGKDTGKKPGHTPGEFKVEVPSDYRIVITDPKLGKLVYEAKIGLVPDNLL
jgi:hypothetical protein